MKRLQKFNILNIKLNPINKYQALARVEELFAKKSPALICTVNVEFIMCAQKDLEFKKILNQKSALNMLDGSGVVWAYDFMSRPYPKTATFRFIYIVLQWLTGLIFYPFVSLSAAKKYPKISGADFVWDICQWASDNNKSIFILGNKGGLDPNAVQKASLELQTKIYDLKIAGTMNIFPDQIEDRNASEMIKKSGADIVFCALGSPAQEKWLARNLGRSGAQIGVGLGGTFDFIAGVQRRAPRFISALGFEWLFRLITRPKRILRQSVLPKFALAVLKQKLELTNSADQT